jgi:6-phosphofructokinase
MSVSLSSQIDRSLAYLSGRAAVDSIVIGTGGIMVAIERDASFPPGFATRLVDLGDVANRVRSLPQAYFDYRTLGPTDAFASYALPLLGPDPFPPYARFDPAI